jgi:lipopolysaccharide/colanic/teichoic acid biosynthesis glycosyltransferase
MQNILSAILLIILLPIILIGIVLIYITSGYPAFFKQQRIGKNQRTFTIYKFRTMKDGKITLFGRVLRKTGFDEIPQLVNIIKGEMSFVGPRPLTSEDINRLQWNTKDHSIRWTVKPGITGVAQLSNVCDANASWLNDVEYIQKKSAKLDLQIVGRSIMIPFIGKTKAKQLIHKSVR